MDRLSQCITFEDCMMLELRYMKAEFHSIEKKDYDAANFFHNMRWKCMDAAVKLVEQESKNG